MGKYIERDTFDEPEYARFAQRLQHCLSALEELLDRPGFGVGPATIGAELELFLVDHAGRPLPRNQAVRVASADPRVTVELDRFNLELNASPARLAGRPFAALSRELTILLDRVADTAGAFGGRPVLIGILPTLQQSDLGPGRSPTCRGTRRSTTACGRYDMARSRFASRALIRWSWSATT